MRKSDPVKATAQLSALLGENLAGLRVGLLGGSFNPAHEGHLHISLVAMTRLKLDRVIWLVSPQNPLKAQSGMAPLAARIDAARKLARHPKIRVTAVEAALGTRFTIDTLRALRHSAPATAFFWLMGSDNALAFPRWWRWRDIAAETPIAVIARPGSEISARLSPAAQKLARAHPFVFIEAQLHPASATAIRAKGLWPAAR